jgi:ATP-dependent DNA helicase PIF1
MLGRVRKSPAAVARWHRTRVLVIDEISMLDPTLFEQLEFLAKELRQGRREGFGGMQLLLCGDFLQLPPIEDKDAQSAWAFCFETPAWSRCCLNQGTVILQQAVRQSGDLQFARLLNEVPNIAEVPRATMVQ